MEDGPNFTMGDLLHDLVERFGAPRSYSEKIGQEDGIYTTTEIAEHFGISKHMALEEIKRRAERGEIEIVRKRVKRFGSDSGVTVQAYKKKEKADEKD